ncbi:hypothetical protein [Sorangium sp. So ce887]|uniref:hypothetical protein n=1 Tax=Sorangium sp. So ce887 TaxID=3133324 RepID=UPI003F6131D6
MKLEDVTNGASLEGVEPSSVVTVVAAIPIPPGSLQLIYRLPDGSLLDADHFYGRFRDGAHAVDTSDLMRRRVKEEASAGEVPETKDPLDLFEGKP